jgi:dTMP kinase
MHKLIVIDGIDGSGKTTQIKLLSKKLKAKKIPFEVISFPQYGKNQYSRQIEDYLEGKLGKIEEVDPYFIAKVYANDRLTSRDLIKKWLSEGKIVITNRYVSSSKAHLGANISEEKREGFMKWVDQLEYKTNKMPKPDLNILLKIDPKTAQKNAFLDLKTDIHEEDLEHEQKASEIYLQLSRSEENWKVLECMNGADMKSEEEINKEIIGLI